jgi:glyoxylase-like metal-dependent hydrolase (beta-lactamase superfamily II)
MIEILPGFFTFTGLILGRVYAIADPDGLTLVDASIPSAGPKIIKQVQQKGYSPADVKRILITHAHPDHIGALKLLAEASGAEVIASEPEARVIRGEIPIVRPSKKDSPKRDRTPGSMERSREEIEVDRIVRGGEVLEDVMEGLRVLDTPGHAPGHISFWHQGKRALITGDVVMNMVGMTLPFPFATPDMDENIRSIQKIASLEPEVICFGHGPVIHSQASEKLKAFERKVKPASG